METDEYFQQEPDNFDKIISFMQFLPGRSTHVQTVVDVYYINEIRTLVHRFADLSNTDSNQAIY